MKDPDQALRRVQRANPVPTADMISDVRLAELDQLVSEGRSTGSDSGTLDPTRRPKRWWVRPVAAIGTAGLLAAAVIGVASLTTQRRGSESAGALSSIVSSPQVRQWNSILATTMARQVPELPACDSTSEPNEPGPADQERPHSGWTGSLNAVFDPGAGSVVYVDERLDTWAFDVCTNVWELLDTTGTPIDNPSAGLVHDADSGVSVALGHEISVFDADTHTWTRPSAVDGARPGDPYGAVYDPVSGLIVTSVYPDGLTGPNARLEAWAYDVDVNKWTMLGLIGVAGEDIDWRYDLVGYSAAIDRLIFLAPQSATQRHTLLLDPRTGVRELVWGDSPIVNLIWPQAHYGIGRDTVFVAGVETAGLSETPLICAFDPNALKWDDCLVGPDRGGFGQFIWFGAMVEDPINDRLLLVDGLFGEFGAMSSGKVWAIESASDQVRVLLASDRGL